MLFPAVYVGDCGWENPPAQCMINRLISLALGTQKDLTSVDWMICRELTIFIVLPVRDECGTGRR